MQAVPFDRKRAPFPINNPAEGRLRVRDKGESGELLLGEQDRDLEEFESKVCELKPQRHREQPIKL